MPEGITVYKESGESGTLAIMDEEGEWMKPATNPEEGVIGFENEESSVSVYFLED